MSDEDRRDKAPPDYDLTTPNVYVPQPGGQGARPPQPAGPDDRTSVNMPVARPEGARPADARAPEGQPNQYDLTAVNLGGFSFDEDDEDQAAPPRPPQPAAPTYHPAPAAYPQAPVAAPQQRAPRARRGVPAWVWLGTGGLLLLASGGALAYFFLSPPASFTLRILGAPPGSKVFIDDIPSGVPQRDGSIIVQGLRPGEPREVRVTQEGHAEWKTTVSGRSGETQDVNARLTPLQAPTSLPPEIDYDGKMLLIAAGPFTLGFDGAGAEEAPAQSVELPDFYIDKFEVTNEQYAKFCAATGVARPVNPFWNPKYFEDNPRMPVIGVSYAEAARYAAWAGKRLPIEAEWEKAASWGPGAAAAKRQYPWGEAVEPGRANLDSEHPTEVGSHPSGASAYGVSDMSGNAREWVDAFFAPYPGGAQSNPNYGRGLRVVRGGDFRAGPRFARTTSRLGVAPEFKTNPGDEQAGRSSLVGFRCAISADDPRLKTLVQQYRKR